MGGRAGREGWPGVGGGEVGQEWVEGGHPVDFGHLPKVQVQYALGHLGRQNCCAVLRDAVEQTRRRVEFGRTRGGARGGRRRRETTRQVPPRGGDMGGEVPGAE